MEFTDRVVVHAPPDRVWEFLLDPERVARCFPEVERLERLGPTAVRATVPVRVAFLSLRVVVDVEVVDQAPPEHATFRLHATGPGSTVDGHVSFTLADAAAEGSPGGSVLAWSVDIEPKGMAASIGADTVQRQAAPVLLRAIDCLRRSVEAA